MIQHAVDRLYEKMDEKKTPLMIGLDPNLAKFPKPLLDEIAKELESEDPSQLRAAAAEVIRRFNFAIIDATADLVPIYKPQSAYYEQYGSAGIKSLEDTIAHARKKGALICLDAKRNDIGSTSTAYAEAHLGQVTVPGREVPVRSADDADFMTVNGYLGTDGVKPFIDVADRDGKGIFVLAKTSNPSAGELQDLLLKDGPSVYQKMAELIDKWGKGNIGKNGYSNVGVVVGATKPEEASKLRVMLPLTLFLMPGYGAQGAAAEKLVNGFYSDGKGAVVNSARGILYASSNKKFAERHPELAKPERFAEAARQATIDSIVEINEALKKADKLPNQWAA